MQRHAKNPLAADRQFDQEGNRCWAPPLGWSHISQSWRETKTARVFVWMVFTFSSPAVCFCLVSGATRGSDTQLNDFDRCMTIETLDEFRSSLSTRGTFVGAATTVSRPQIGHLPISGKGALLFQPTFTACLACTIIVRICSNSTAMYCCCYRLPSGFVRASCKVKFARYCTFGRSSTN